MENKNTAIVGGHLVTQNGNPNISFGLFLSLDRIKHDYGIKKRSREYFQKELRTAKICEFTEPTIVDHLTGAAIMIKREFILKYGLLDPRYFMYLEDMELGFRC